MNWRLKVAGFKALSSLPGGKAFYRFAQKNITGSLRPTDSRVSQKVEVAIRYFDWLKQHGYRECLGGTHVDFGAGWHPTIPLVFYSVGMQQQYLFDLSPLLDQQLVEQTVEILLSLLSQARWSQAVQPSRLPPRVEERPWREYLKNLRIEYLAPYNGTWSSLSGKVDLVTSTQVLLHIPRPILADCFSNIFKTLKKGGLFLATIHLRDLVSCVQPGVSKYNYLRYSNQSWERWVNSSLMSYSRLRAVDYKELLEGAGFEVAGFEVEHGTEQDLAELDKIPIASCFQRYSREELAAKHLFFAARKP